MNAPNEDLVRELHALAVELGEAAVGLDLIGGLAVHVQCSRYHAALASHRDVDPWDPRAIAMQVRTTQDMDIVVDALDRERAIERLESLGYQRRSDQRWTRGHMRVDLIARATHGGGTELGALLYALRDHFEPERPPMRIASLPTLVVLKARAWFDRHANRDLVDLGRIAVLDRQSGRVRSELAELLPRLPDRARRDVESVAGTFKARAVLEAARAALPGVSPDEEVWDELGAFVEASVRALSKA